MQLLSERKGWAAVIAGLSILLSPTAGTADTHGENMNSQNESAIEGKPPLEAMLPEGYRLALSMPGRMDDAEIVLRRFQPSGRASVDLGGEHVSFVVEQESERLKGFTRLYGGVSDGALPTEDVARQVALGFLHRQAPDLLSNHKILWIDRHDEQVQAEGRKVTLSGMKVKFRNLDDGLYFWVILAADGSVMTFERDIHWITFPGHRGTEKWLHDSWLQQQENLVLSEFESSESRIEAVVENYFRGAFHGDRARLEGAFDPAARIVGFFGDDRADLSVADFVDLVVSQPSQASLGATMDKRILSVEVAGRIAVVKARVPVGETVYIDLLTLHETADGWRIRHKSFDLAEASPV